MLKKISIILSILALSGCATTQNSWSAIGGSRADGVIKLAYPTDLFNNSVPGEAQGTMLAAQRCKVWGYKNAVPFGGNTLQCESRNSFGSCLRGTVIKEYQCTGETK